MPATPPPSVTVIDGIKFCTVQQCRGITTIHPSFANFNDRIENYLRVATTQVIQTCNRDFVAKTGIVQYAGTPDRRWHDLAYPEFEPYSIYLREPNVNPDTIKVYLSYRYVFTDATLCVIGNNDGANEEFSIPGGDIGIEVFGTGQDYFLEPLSTNDALTKVTFTRELVHHPKSVKIVYDAGYPVDTNDAALVLVPRELVQSVAIQAGFLMSRAGNEDAAMDGRRKGVLRRDPFITPSGLCMEAAGLVRGWGRSLTASI
jgi:hypothetical protein